MTHHCKSNIVISCSFCNAELIVSWVKTHRIFQRNLCTWLHKDWHLPAILPHESDCGVDTDLQHFLCTGFRNFCRILQMEWMFCIIPSVLFARLCLIFTEKRNHFLLLHGSGSTVKVFRSIKMQTALFSISDFSACLIPFFHGSGLSGSWILQRCQIQQHTVFQVQLVSCVKLQKVLQL